MFRIAEFEIYMATELLKDNDEHVNVLAFEVSLMIQLIIKRFNIPMVSMDAYLCSFIKFNFSSDIFIPNITAGALVFHGCQSAEAFLLLATLMEMCTCMTK
jgi:hypothetical protein